MNTNTREKRYGTKWLSKIIDGDPEGKEFGRVGVARRKESRTSHEKTSNRDGARRGEGGGDVPMMVGVRVLVPSAEDEKMKGIPAVEPPLCFCLPQPSANWT
ncbi:hypothetical protein K0M31_008504 [Melipona bicolor]|uniref:Uncharacterized protein n=1 Tax=Melipona bicolor TaxID=60889 RepID=A0AA40FRS0_9HYME|nr:hypothetical protein K0M31_008504 [Melipona bicolor]